MMDGQHKKILDWMQSHCGITTKEACDNLRIFRLASRISEFREMPGYTVADAWEYKYDTEGKVIERWKRYWVVKDA